MAVPQAVLQQLEDAKEKQKQMQLAGNTETETSPAAVVEEAPQRGEDSSDWQHKYVVLQAKYNAEVPRYAEELRNLRGQMNGLMQSNTELIQKIDQYAKPPEKEVELELSEMNEFPNFVGDVNKIVDHKMKREVDAKVKEALSQFQPQVPNELVDRLNHVESTQAVTVEQVFFNDLTFLVPDWEKINDDPKFSDWLDQMDGFSGYRRRVILDDARRKCHAQRVAAFFTAWKAETGVQKPKPTVPSGRVQPSGNRSSGGVPEKPIYTVEQVTKFYNDVARNQFRGTKEEAEHIKRDIVAAQAEGRIKR